MATEKIRVGIIGASMRNGWGRDAHIPALSAKRERVTIRRYFDAAKKAGATTEVLESNDPISAIVDFARQKRITQIFIGHSAHNSWRDRLFGDPVLRLIRAAEGIDVRVFPH